MAGSNRVRTPPGNPSFIELIYTHRQFWNDSPDEEPETWHVSADIYDADGRTIESHVGDMEFVVVDLAENRSAFDTLDGIDGDLGAVAAAVLAPSTNELRAELDESLVSFASRILIVNRVQLVDEWRGFGLGVVLTGVAVGQLRHGCRAAFCYPASIDGSAPGNDRIRRKAAADRIAKVWMQLGFEPFRDGVYVLDLGLVTLDDCVERLRERLPNLTWME